MEKIDTDLVIAGSGAAGLCAALTAQSHLKRILWVKFSFDLYLGLE